MQSPRRTATRYKKLAYRYATMLALAWIILGLSLCKHAVIAHDGIEEWSHAMERQAHCAIIDIKMPGLDGLQLVRALRGDLITRDMPLIILTAMPEEQGKR